ncbi:hypothetical protein QTP88_020505 [Uroleucon formosanum]
MSNNYSGDNDSLNLNEKERNEKLIKEHDCLVNEPSLKFQQLVSIFENQESETKFKFLQELLLEVEKLDSVFDSIKRDIHVHANLALSQGRLITTTTTAEELVQADQARKVKRADGVDGAEDTDEADVSSTDDSERSDSRPAQGVAVPSGGTAPNSAAYTSTVAVTNHGGNWIGHSERNLLFVIHPWCMLHKSGVDRQSEFPPPGFLERLKNKLMALHRQSDEQQRYSPAKATVVRRRRHTHQRIKSWFQYTATVHSAYPRNEPVAAAVDFLSVWQRCANSVAAAYRAADSD